MCQPKNHRRGEPSMISASASVIAMSRTRRIYNSYQNFGRFETPFKPNGHPYLVLCMGNCRTCRKWKLKEKQQKTTKKRFSIKLSTYLS